MAVGRLTALFRVLILLRKAKILRAGRTGWKAVLRNYVAGE
jgi:hypothetical protein